MMEPNILINLAFILVGLEWRAKNENNEIPKMWQDRMGRYTVISNPPRKVGTHANEPVRGL